MIMPDRREFIAALEKVNKEIKNASGAPTPLSFFEQGETAYVNDYLENFANGRLPIAPTGNHFLHDMSFHTGGLFVPGSFVEFARARTKFVIDFSHHLEKINSDQPESVRVAIHAHMRSAVLETAKSIDEGTGLLSSYLIAYMKDPHSEKLENHIGEAIGGFVASSAGDSVDDGLKVYTNHVYEK